jgi:phage terminase large subunit GpA-like protein
MPITFLSAPDVETARSSSLVRSMLPIVAWAMLRFNNVHSRAFRGRYSPETAPWGVEMLECQYWPHVRSVDTVASTQIGKSAHMAEIPVLYELCERNETVFYMNGSADNALNMWTGRWEKILDADPVLARQKLDRMEGGRWQERHFRDGGVLYSTGPESTSALAQRESRIVRCSELEKTKGALGNEASSYALARDRSAAYPSTHIITSDCTCTVDEGLAWVRFVGGDRSRLFVPCPSCGRYAMPAHERHLEKAELCLTINDVHLLEISPLSAATPIAAEETARLVCKGCSYVFSDKTFKAALRAGVWVPVGCKIVRHDDAKGLPKVSWLDDLRNWAGWQHARPDVMDGTIEPDPPPAWSGPRLPDGVELVWDRQDAAPGDEQTLPGMRDDPRRSSKRSFWLWRIFSPRYTIGQVAREIVEGETGTATGDLIDDQKNMTQKTLCLPYKEKIIGETDDLTPRVVLMASCELPPGRLPERVVAVTSGVDINEDAVRAVKRAWTEDGESYLVEKLAEPTGLVAFKHEQGRDEKSARFIATRDAAILAALDRVWTWICKTQCDRMLTYVDSGFLSGSVYDWCGGKSFDRVRPSKGFGTVGMGGKRRKGSLAGTWTDACDQRASQCVDARGRPLKHQYYDEKDIRKMMRLDADHWKKEVHNAIKLWSLHAKAVQMKVTEGLPRPWFFIHSGFGLNDDYIKQVVGERFEEREDPRTKRKESGWKEYHAEWHFLDGEAYAFAAAAALGIRFGGANTPEPAPGANKPPWPQAGTGQSRPQMPNIPQDFMRERF